MSKKTVYIHPDITANIRRLVCDSGLSQKEFGERIRVDRKTVNAWVNGRMVPDINNLRKMCKTFGVSADEVLEIKRKK